MTGDSRVPGREDRDFLLAVYSSLRQELGSRWTMLYALGTLTWGIVAGTLAAIYLSPVKPFYDLALFVLPVILILGVIFSGEMVWMSSMHATCRRIEAYFGAEWTTESKAALLWHGNRVFFSQFPGAVWMAVGAASLFVSSVTALLYPLYSALTEPGGLPASVADVIVIAFVAAAVGVPAIGLRQARVEQRPR
jgi:hypothetical protein